MGGPARRTGEEEAEYERRQTQQTAADEEKCITFEERPPDCEMFDRHARKSFEELPEVRVRRTKERVLCRGVPDAGQARHVRHERDAREGDPEVVGEHDRTEE